MKGECGVGSLREVTVVEAEAAAPGGGEGEDEDGAADGGRRTADGGRAGGSDARPMNISSPTARRARPGAFGRRDITQKGYEKKRTRLLAPYAPKQAQEEAVNNAECKPSCGERLSLVLQLRPPPAGSSRGRAAPSAASPTTRSATTQVTLRPADKSAQNIK
ncbi:Protein of unknown function [Gryllus bimaculatus]|nr:Protein of unknown function [Gryllus bimaculatus]